MDYTISWSYIVNRMESLYGISPDSEEKYSFGELEKHINYIWHEYFEILYNEEFGNPKAFYERCKDCSYLVEKDGKWFCEDSNQACIDVRWCIVEA